ncbi:hypothetical protein AB1K70_19140 [Bremerella sp. JC770]|uniref:hypothetical protein n=1 Tax=Bremerella sp. JC770 TaxID=3232137 RepID=UPI003458D877
MKLSDYVETYILEHDIADTTAEGYRYCVSGFERWHGRPIEIESDLTTDLANQWLTWLKSVGRSTHTCKSRRGELLTLWRAARRDRRIDFDKDPEFVRRVRTDELDPECFTHEQAGLLLRQCQDLTGTVGSLTIPRAIYFGSFVRAAWDSGLRLGDLLAFDEQTVDAIIQGQGSIRIRQSKSRRYVDCHFHPSTVEAIRKCWECVPRTSEIFGLFPPSLSGFGIQDRRSELPTDRVWPQWSLDRKPWHREFKLVVESAGLRGGTKYLRRGAATEAELLTPGSAARKLGHSPHSAGLAEKHYISRKVLPMAPVVGRELSATS